MIMKKHLFAMVCMAVSLWSCSNDDAPVVGGPENGKVSAEAQAALFQLYPNATDVNWSVKGEYVVADFNMACSSRRICGLVRQCRPVVHDDGQ